MSFSTDIRKWADKAQKGYVDVASAALYQISSEIIRRTPVDTGRARGNWFAEIGKAHNGTTESKTANFSDVESKSINSIGDIFFFTNNLPYIKSLEFEGHSKQAPAGMVRVSIENFNKHLDNAISQLT